MSPSDDAKAISTAQTSPKLSYLATALQRCIDEAKADAEEWAALITDPKDRQLDHHYDTGYIAGLEDALIELQKAEKELEERILAAYEEYGVPLT